MGLLVTERTKDTERGYLGGHTLVGENGAFAQKISCNGWDVLRDTDPLQIGDSYRQSVRNSWQIYYFRGYNTLFSNLRFTGLLKTL
jgi:hypothetical protein